MKDIDEAREELKDKLIETKEFKQYRRILKTIQERIDMEKLERQMKNIHAGRPSRNLEDPKKINPRDLIEANGRDLANRSRLVEIRVELFKEQSALKEAVGATLRFLVSEFYEVPGVKTTTAKKDYFKRYFKTAYALVAELDRLIDMADRFVDDIDQAGFKLKHIQEMLELIYTRERSI